jgi:HlyD family secretion protein
VSRFPLVLLLAFLSAGCGDAKPAGGRVLARYTVQRGDLAITITENAALKSAKTERLQSKVQGRIASIVADGAMVKKGDKLLELTNDELKQTLEQTVLELEKAERAITTAQGALKLHDLEAAKKRDDAARALRFATMALEQYREGTAPLQDRELALAAERAAIDAQDASEKHRRMPGLLAQDFVTAAEVRTAELTARENAAKAEKAQRELENLRTYENPQELAKREADVRDAELGVRRVEDSATTERADKEAEIRAQTQHRDGQARKLKELQEQVSCLVVISPGDGIALYGDESQRRWGNQEEMQVGQDVHQGMALMSILDLSSMLAEATVNELNVSRVQVGMKTETRIESLGRSFPGEVTKVATTNMQNWRSDEKQYATELTMTGTAGLSFRPGMSARVIFMVDQLKDVLTVPVEAVYRRKGKTVCYVAGVPREVELGQGTDERVVVVKGLAAGDEVEVLAVEPGE